MLVAEKKHHIESVIHGQGAEYIVSILKKELPDLEVITSSPPNIQEEFDPSDDELIYAEDSEWYKEMSARMTPGIMLRIRRENRGWTQTELSEKTGIAIPNISLMESDKRVIGLRTARKLAKALGCSTDDFLME